MVNFKKTKIPFFRRFVLQNFPFIEQDFDALTDYELICKVVEFLNAVIESTNVSSEQVEQLTTLYNELKTYVDNYFGNLDVQNEINNKLDAMVEDGTLSNIIEPILETYNEDLLNFQKLTNWDNLKYEKHYDETSNTTYYITEFPLNNPYTGKNIMRVGLANDDTTMMTVEKPTEFAIRNSSPLVTNAGIFYSNAEFPTAYGLVIKDGVILKQETVPDEYYSDILAIKENGDMKSYPVRTNPQSIINDGYVDAIVGFHVLIENGEVVDTSSYQNTAASPRQVVCRKTNGDYLFLTCDGRTIENQGLTLADTLRILGTIDNIDFAFELDGGGSTGTVVKSKKINKNIDHYGIEERKVPTMLYITSKANELYSLSGENSNLAQVDSAKQDLKYRQIPSAYSYFTGNLFNRNDPNFSVNKYVNNGTIVDYTNPAGEDNDVMLSDFIQVPAESSIYCVNAGSDFKFVYLYDENKNWLYTYNYATLTNPVMTISGRIAYIRVVVRKRCMSTFGIYIGDTYVDHYEENKYLKPVVLFENLTGATTATLGYIGRYQKLKIYVTDSSSQQDSKEVLLGLSGGSIYTFFERVQQSSTNGFTILTSRVSINKATGEVTIDREYNDALLSTPTITITDNAGRLKITRVEGY